MNPLMKPLVDHKRDLLAEMATRPAAAVCCC